MQLYVAFVSSKIGSKNIFRREKLSPPSLPFHNYLTIFYRNAFISPVFTAPCYKSICSLFSYFNLIIELCEFNLVCIQEKQSSIAIHPLLSVFSCRHAIGGFELPAEGRLLLISATHHKDVNGFVGIILEHLHEQ